MNARIINLRTARKQRARRDAKAAADQNALDHGRTKAERAATQVETARITRLHDGHRRQTPGEGTDDDGA